MKLITDQFIGGFKAYRFKMGTNRAVAQKCGISEVHVGRLLAGQCEMLKDETYDRIFPLVKPFLDESAIAALPAPRPARYAEKGDGSGYSDMERLLVKYFRLFDEDEKPKFLVSLQEKLAKK